MLNSVSGKSGNNWLTDEIDNTKQKFLFSMF